MHLHNTGIDHANPGVFADIARSYGWTGAGVGVAVIDSGVGVDAQGNDELDGLSVTHKTVAPTSGSPVDHGLGVVSLLADKNDDADGIGGLLGAWNSNGCYGRERGRGTPPSR